MEFISKMLSKVGVSYGPNQQASIKPNVETLQAPTTIYVFIGSLDSNVAVELFHQLVSGR